MADPQTEDRPLFICGPSRSGTTLLQNILEKNSDYAIAPETHFFDDLRPRMAGRELGPDEQRICEDYFLRLSHQPYGHAADPEQGWLTREELQAQIDPSLGVDSYFYAFVRAHAARLGQSQWGEKTPRHVFRVGEILEHFPEARVICMVRDPRAIVSSYRDWSRRHEFRQSYAPESERKRLRDSYHPILISLLWRGAIRAARQAHQQYGGERVYIQRYENLVLDADRAIAELSDWLGRNLAEDGLEVPLVNSNYASDQGGSGFQAQAVDRWRERLSPAEIRVVEHCTHGLMRQYDYPRAAKGGRWGATGLWLGVGPAAFRAARANASRSGGLPSYVWRRAKQSLGMG
jgi:hypothetical protein